MAAVNYRLISQAMEQKIEPPVKASLRDAARALQTIRSKAREWNLDPRRIGAMGVSAGACTSLWLALHNDLADPKSSDPIARESTRLTCAGGNGAQRRSTLKRCASGCRTRFTEVTPSVSPRPVAAEPRSSSC